MPERASASPALPSPADLLRAALEKIVFFEWRLSELAAELSAAQSRCASAELERARADESARVAQAQAQAARLQLAELEADRSRLASLLARPAHPLHEGVSEALEAQRERCAVLEADLLEAQRALAAQKAERARWLNEMIEQARSGDEAPAALAQFISELRGEVLALRDRQRQCDALLAEAGIAPPQSASSIPPPPVPHRESEPLEIARKMWAEGRIGGAPMSAGAMSAVGAAPMSAAAMSAVGAGAMSAGAMSAESGSAAADQPAPLAPAMSAAAPAHAASEMSAQGQGAAARALGEQCLRALSSRDAHRREQAARHLAAMPQRSAAPLLAQALGREPEPRTRAQLARALACCGGDSSADIVSALQAPEEHALVRLAALEALCGLGGDRARSALETASLDPAPAVRRRAAALAAATEGAEDIVRRLGADEDASVRRVRETASREAPAEAAPKPRDVAHDALLAVQAAIFGLTEGELADTLGLPEPEIGPVAARLVQGGQLGRRGKRLIAAQGA